MAKKTDKVKNCTQTHCPEQTLGTTSIATPTTPRGNPTPRCSNKLRIRRVEVETSAQMPGVTGPPQDTGMEGSPPSQGHRYHPVWTSALSRSWTLASHQVPQHPEEARFPGALTCPGTEVLWNARITEEAQLPGDQTQPGSQDNKIPGSQDQSWTLWSCDTRRITGGTGCTVRDSKGTRDNQMLRAKLKNLSNRNQDFLRSIIRTQSSHYSKS